MFRPLKLKWILINQLIFLAFFSVIATAQSSSSGYRELNVNNGLPQSFISGLAQDRQGFIWIGTKDGLARYDGKKFKVFKNVKNDPNTLLASVIIGFSLDNADQLWIAYANGHMDILNTYTEQIFHLTKHPAYQQLFLNIKGGSSVVRDAALNYWVLCNKGGLYLVNLHKRSVRYYTEKEFNLTGSPITGIAANEDQVVLVNQTKLAYVSTALKVLKTITYGLHVKQRPILEVNNMPVCRRNGDVIIFTKGRITIYNKKLNSFIYITLPIINLNRPPAWAADQYGNLYFDYIGKIYKLNLKNKLLVWRELSQKNQNTVNILIDRSGVLWRGTNGYGLQLFDMRLQRMPQFRYQKNFATDLLTNHLNGNTAWTTRNFISPTDSYLFRWLEEKRNRKIWILAARIDKTNYQQIAYYRQGKFNIQTWKFQGNFPNYAIGQIALSASGKLWGLDYFLRPLLLDTTKQLATPFAKIPAKNMELRHDVAAFLIDGEDDFWISTTLGLVYYNMRTKLSKHFIDELPSIELTHMIEDPKDKRYLWIGSLGGGLIKFNKQTHKYQTYTTQDDLPNNTIYAIIATDPETFWCSSNKGIFSFNSRTKAVQSFTMLDGLALDEFNRFHFFSLPDGKLAFGGTNGYTVFDPKKVASDHFVPMPTLTGVSINNKPADFGLAGSPFKQAINSLTEIRLPYNQNSLILNFAADEYNIPEKLRYRYELAGFDEQWVNSAGDNSLTYTNIPPGRYTLKINVTNTAGLWSPKTKTLTVIITPPWWGTWWFVIVMVTTVGITAYFIVRQRIKNIRRKEQEKHKIEQDIMRLEAQALRSQMNPHFIFNCLNSIKALMQEDDKQHAIDYLTTFARLIRGQLNNAKGEISLYEELETCKLYVQLESLRFADKLNCRFIVDENAPLHEILVPPLILQPFIENAIWHGVLPLADGGDILINVFQNLDVIECTIDDNGVGREAVAKNIRHQSKGLQLVEDRINLHNQINANAASIEVIDKKDKNNNPIGTLVKLRFKLPHD
ncbi:ligand-binding sensor domain-containing protein/anti-sigma regulatory factor (Ser/Thr protein kinase) [Pedobacter sp. W3I1]|uniref:sensor histidine kinase n=1 Tax=Pedobacter sp. W3I1 TaxID=3042291 RepID=UPI002784D46B|nr:sensor histidine kinase [Pedobacter sp. W3I1]MDQ0640271.1 ligand-binding sensor domain-containing protein/anti-sigma regulatory factor (Ser/Thr protein kinase) [Pedobacter sp. W3I1]